MATKKDKPESSQVKAFKAKYGNAKKPFPSAEAAALEAAEEKNYNEPAKPVKNKKDLVITFASVDSDKEREKQLKNATEIITNLNEEPVIVKKTVLTKKGK